MHHVPFYTVSLSMSDEATDTKIIDGKTIWYKINTTDSNTSDGNITFRENNSAGKLIAEIQYADEDYGQELSIFFLDTFTTYTYNLMVDEIGSSARVWLFFQTFPSYDIIEADFNKFAWFGGTDTDEDGETDFDFYLPHSHYLPAQMGGDLNFDMNDTYVGIWVIDEDGDHSYDLKTHIDTGTGGLITLGPELSTYWYEADYDQGTEFLDEDPSTPYPSSAYTSYGSFIKLVDHEYTATIPENEVVRCSNGTPSGECSGLNYCSNGEFVSACNFCGCTAGEVCKKIGGSPTCVAGGSVPVDR